MPDLGPAELIIVLAIVVLVFGGTRLAEVGGSLGKGIKEFRKAMQDDDQGKAETAAAAQGSPAIASPAPSAGGVACSQCGTVNTSAARFCSECGATLAQPVPAAAASEGSNSEA